jgi:Glucodextranase, domain B
MFPHSDSRWTRVALTGFFIVIVLYGYYEARGLLFGPTIAIGSEVTTVREAFIEVSGRADRIVSLKMNGREITVTEKGDFIEPYLLAPGINRIMFDALDRYGNKTSKTVEIVYVHSADEASPTPALRPSTTPSE